MEAKWLKSNALWYVFGPFRLKSFKDLHFRLSLSFVHHSTIRKVQINLDREKFNLLELLKEQKIW